MWEISVSKFARFLNITYHVSLVKTVAFYFCEQFLRKHKNKVFLLENETVTVSLTQFTNQKRLWLVDLRFYHR